MGSQKMKPQQKPWIKTPLTESANLSKAAGCRIFLKHDHLQPSGSFKSRGLGAYMLSCLSASSNPEKVHFYCSSGGNAGLACVHAANSLGRPATIVVPHSTKHFMIAKLRAAGADAVIQEGKVWAEADAYLREKVIATAEVKGEEGVYVPPFDHPDIWEGHSSIIHEVKDQLEEREGTGARPDVIICSSGGGGLFNGIVDGVEQYGWHEAGTQVLVLGTYGADALYQCREQGKHAKLSGITSQATSLGCSQVSKRSYELVTNRGYVVPARLSDEEAAMGCWRLADDERLLVELACGVNVALCYGGRLEKALGRKVRSDEIVVIEVCGGNAITVDMICEWKREYGHLGDELKATEKKTVPSAVST